MEELKDDEENEQAEVYFDAVADHPSNAEEGNLYRVAVEEGERDGVDPLVQRDQGGAFCEVPSSTVEAEKVP